jgi:hypothetical protein
VKLRPNWSRSFELFDFSPAPRRRPAAPARAGEHADDLVADLLGVGVEVEQDPRGDALVLADEAEQDVLGADVVVTQRERFAQRELEHLLRARRERIWPVVTSSPWPTMRAIWARTSSTVMSRDSSTLAASPSSSRRSRAGCARCRCSCA